MSEEKAVERARPWEELYIGRTWTTTGSLVKCFNCGELAKLESKVVCGGFKPDLQYTQPKTVYRVHCEACGVALPVEHTSCDATGQPRASKSAHSSDGQITNLAPPAGQREWIHTRDHLPPNGLVVETKIDDADGCRNQQTLKRSGNLWFSPDASMQHVYYTPTHWRTR